jgi:SAM-dependent methyltransferase
MYKVVTDSKGAFYSLDHKFPRGAYNEAGGPEYDWENGYNPYMDELREYFSNIENPKFLDLGCASGNLVKDAMSRGFDAVGIDGTDVPLKADREMWKKYYQSRLFITDLTEPFNIEQDGERVEFDVINAWEVLEHLRPHSLHIAVKNIYNHLKKDGLLVVSISPFKTRHKPNLHMSWDIPIDEWKNSVFRDFIFVGPVKGKTRCNYHYIFKNRYRGRDNRDKRKTNRITYWSTIMKK